MIEARRLLADLQRQVRGLEADLRARARSDRDVDDRLHKRYQEAKTGCRTGVGYETWLDQQLTQVAVGWVLACVFTRFCEDNTLLGRPMLAGPVRPEQEADETGEARERVDGVAEAREWQTFYFQAEDHKNDSDLDYLRAAVARLEAYDATRDLVNRHNPLHLVDISPDAATGLLEFWRRIDPETGALVHDFSDPASSTRFLGDLYQDLSEQARKDYALLQTPEFVEEFILGRTLAPAIDEFGLAEVRMIDPACGSGHFLLGAFDLLLDRWQKQEHGIDVKVHVERVLGQVHGVDINPFAAAIARFRLVIAALAVCGITRLVDAPVWRIRIAIGDSLLWGTEDQQDELDGVATHALTGSTGEGEFTYEYEDARELKEILEARYHAVVGNPPYITVKDRAPSNAYRVRWSACHRQYALSVPFAQRFFRLAVNGGFTGQITANSFMKREFGKKLIEEFFPSVDLTLLVDTSGAYIPGHGTPTVLIFGRHRRPIGAQVRAALGVRGEPSAPADPAKGLVWTRIVENFANADHTDAYISTLGIKRIDLARHPWSLAGGGAAQLQAQIDTTSARLHNLGVDIGRTVQLGEDDAWILAHSSPAVTRFQDNMVPHVFGELVRDYTIEQPPIAINPYADITKGIPLLKDQEVVQNLLWPNRTILSARTIFGRSLAENDRPWYAYLEIYANRLHTPLAIAFPFVSTHNHFTLDRGGKIFNRTATVLKLPEGATEEKHLRLVGVLNSSAACFWLKQVSQPKSGSGIGRGIQDEAWENRYEFTGTKLKEFPLPDGAPLVLATRLDGLAQELQRVAPAAVARDAVPTREALVHARAEWERIRAEMISAQEELDWEVYGLYGLLGDDADGLIGSSVTKPPLALGERAFEIVLARQHDAGETETEWFTRHRSTPIIQLPAHWPQDYRALVERRLAKIDDDPYLHLIERPECKRRWASRPWAEMEAEALRDWLLDRLEARELWHRPEPTPRTVAQLADELRTDAEFTAVARLYARDTALGDVVADLVRDEHVPFLAAWRYTDMGLRVRAQWERTWDLQREQDAEDERIRAEEERRKESDEPLPPAPPRKIIDIKVPPKYKQTDFRETSYWRSRGKLDVPKERFISYPDASRDGTLLLGWAGWDHLQQAQALATYIADRREVDAWDAEKTKPLLAGLLELLPWVAQWHSELDPEFGIRPADAYTGFLDEQVRQLGLTRDDLTGWLPAARKTRTTVKKPVKKPANKPATTPAKAARS
ncbi:hypothetical protein CcI6DRAFT_03450 [Frankia sp. CcI6]|uniref:BREX-2 system adenine-specific DNA-methyltransferase PglX n=1 Tax=unclassified Frankia TaxID=2632575 RepID=UPI0003D05960|nr:MULTISPECIES: BREX-2 system adenine-specific DNA-methyltransferase PglX [unclassified Frankia]ETA01104.1 hypothetical protein CcI6DRAFT_03450 [Frankia sp. CcI6]OHV52071.1 hypothetical protein CgIS1_17545 [Frankia sp. CgIS1]